MDTNVTAHHDLPADQPVLTARLPDDLHGQHPASDQRSDDAHAIGKRPASAEPGDRLSASAAAPKRRGGRAWLLGGCAVAALAFAGGAFLVSPYNLVYPVPRMASAVRGLAVDVGVIRPSPLAPSAALASVQLPPVQPNVMRDKYEGAPRSSQLGEILALHPAEQHAAVAPPVSAPAASAQPVSVPPTSVPSLSTPEAPASVAARGDRPQGPPPGYVASEPGTASSVVVAVQPSASPVRPATPGPQDVTSAVIASIDPAAVAPTGGTDAATPVPVMRAAPPAAVMNTPTPVVTSTPTSAPTPTLTVTPPTTPSTAQPSEPDPVRVARELRAAPMSGPDQVQVLALVTQLGTMVRDLKTQNAQLRADFAKTVASNGGRLADFERRLELSEARRAMAGAEDAGAADPTPPAVTPVITPAVAGPRVAAGTHVEAVSGAADTARSYRVQAASPGLAMLAQVDRGGGEGAQLQIQVGDTLPGYGKVKSVTQRGVSWVVSTERGIIGQ